MYMTVIPVAMGALETVVKGFKTRQEIENQRQN